MTDKRRTELRLNPELYDLCTEAAEASGCSFNQWAAVVLGMAVGFDEHLALAVEIWGPRAVETRGKR